MQELLKIDHGRLARIEQDRDAARGAYKEASDAYRSIANEIRACVLQRTDLENLPQVMDSAWKQQNYRLRKDLTAKIDALRPKLAEAECIRDAEKERADAANALWESCAKHAGVA